MKEADTLFSGLVFPECPRWRTDSLIFSDMRANTVFSCTLDGRMREVIGVEGRPSGLGWTPDGDMLVVSMDQRKLFRLDASGLALFADLDGFFDGPANDMAVRSNGQAYIGNIGFDLYTGEPPRPTCLLRVDTDRSVHVVATDLHCPNGMQITPDGRTLIVAESHAHRITAFDILDNGDLSGRRLFADLGDCVPDGICLDAEGALWVTDSERTRVFRVSEGGGVSAEISSGKLRAFACELGGPDGRHLFICAAPTTGPANIALRQGRILVSQVETPSAYV